jgi:hypothetical protein
VPRNAWTFPMELHLKGTFLLQKNSGNYVYFGSVPSLSYKLSEAFFHGSGARRAKKYVYAHVRGAFLRG